MVASILNSFKKNYRDKKILVVGLGLLGGGVGIARFFAELGAKVTVTDKKTEKQLLQSINRLKKLPITFHLGGHDIKDFISADVIFKGPSVPWSSLEIVAAQKKNIPIEMEMSFVVAHYQGKVIGITGTRGKSTTTNLIYNLLKESGFNVSLGGGLPGISTIECLRDADENSWLVAELSSWALSGFHRKQISPHIAVFTNFYPDHLNYYNNLDDYFYDKRAIYQYQKKGDFFVTNKSLKEQIEKARTQFFFDKSDFPYKLSYLKGDHNLENAAAALKVAEILKIEKNKAIQIIKKFQGLPYRFQVVGKNEKVTFINDTTSTTPIATIKAIESLKDKKIILLLGGNSKNLPYEQLINQLNKVERIVLLEGSFTNQILDTLKVSKLKVSEKIYNNLEQAIIKAYQFATDLNEESYVLFSPGATSFAMFNNEFHRGEEFNKIVSNIIK